MTGQARSEVSRNPQDLKVISPLDIRNNVRCETSNASFATALCPRLHRRSEDAQKSVD